MGYVQVDPADLRRMSAILDEVQGDYGGLARRLNSGMPAMPPWADARVRAEIDHASWTLVRKGNDLPPVRDDLNRRAAWAELLGTFGVAVGGATSNRRRVPLRGLIDQWRHLRVQWPRRPSPGSTVRAPGGPAKPITPPGSINLQGGTGGNLQGTRPTASKPGGAGGGSGVSQVAPQSKQQPLKVPDFTQQVFGTEPGWKVGNAACGVTSLAMVLAYYGANATPQTVNGDGQLVGEGYWMKWPANFSVGPQQFHLQDIRAGLPASAPAQIDAALKAGTPVIIHMYTHDWGDEQHVHYVVVTGRDSQGNYVINDPWDGATKTLSPTYDVNKVSQLVIVTPK